MSKIIKTLAITAGLLVASVAQAVPDTKVFDCKTTRVNRERDGKVIDYYRPEVSAPFTAQIRNDTIYMSYNKPGTSFVGNGTRMTTIFANGYHFVTQKGKEKTTVAWYKAESTNTGNVHIAIISSYPGEDDNVTVSVCK